MEFNISKKAKNRVQKLRIRKEKKWIFIRAIYLVSFLVAIISLVYGTFVITSAKYLYFDRCATMFAITFIIGIVARVLTLNFTQHWIHSRVNEKMWIEDDILNHFFQVSWGSGWNSRSVDNTGYLFEIDLNTINRVMYNEKTKRIEFGAIGKGHHYSNISSGQIDKQWDLKEGYKCVLYDYYSPSIINVLSERGIRIDNEELNDFSILDNKI